VTVTTRVGASMVQDYNGRLVRFTERTAELATHFILAGISKDAVNAYGERIATYAFTQAGAKGKAPKWIGTAKAAADRYEKMRADEVMIAASQGRDVGAVVDAIGRDTAGMISAVAEAAALKESGALLLAAGDYKTRTHAFRPSFGGSRKRKAAGPMTANQALYQTYHKGRSRSRREMRRAVSFHEIKMQFGAKFRSGEQGQKAARAEISRAANAAQRAARALHPGQRYYSAGRETIIRRSLIGGGL
jgi:hypothetical protein